MKQPQSILGKVLAWRVRHISDRNFIIILSILIGVVSGFLAVGLRLIMNEIHHILTGGFQTAQQNYLYIAYPIIGIFLAMLMIRYLYRGQFDHGITNVLNAISKQSSIVKVKDAMYFLLGSLVTVGSGGSVGLEATLVVSGSSIGSNIGRYLHLPYQSRMLLLGCGVAGAMSAFFNAPIAGMIFALEVLMLDLTMASLIPLLLASVTGILISQLLIGQNIMFHFALDQGFNAGNLHFYIILGVFSALCSVYFSKVTDFMDGVFNKFKDSMGKTLLGASALGLLIFLFPPLYGEGYDAVTAIANNQELQLMDNSLFYDFRNTEGMLLLFIAGIILMKAFAVAFTMGSGGIGGYFAPSLFVGGLTGFLFARIVNFLALGSEVPEINFLLVGMAGVMSGIFHAPLTGVFLIAELTQGYSFIVPLMLVSTISYLVTIFFEPHSLFTKKLAQKGDLITHHKDQAILTMMQLDKLVETGLKTVDPNESLRNILKDKVAESTRNIFPVVDDDNNLLGIILLDDIRKLLLKTELHEEVFAKDLMHDPPAYLYSNEPMDRVIKKFDDTGAWNLPVLDMDGKYKGFLSKSKIFSAYRGLIVQFSEE